MFVKPACERLLMPQYHLANISTQRRNKSIKWHPEEDRPWEAPPSSIDWQDKAKMWLILLDTSSIKVIHMLSKYPLFIWHAMKMSNSAGGQSVSERGATARAGWTIYISKEILKYITNLREGWSTGQKTIKGYMWRSKSRATTATLQASDSAQELNWLKIIYYKSCKGFGFCFHLNSRKSCYNCVHLQYLFMTTECSVQEYLQWNKKWIAGMNTRHQWNTLCTDVTKSFSFYIPFNLSSFYTATAEGI